MNENARSEPILVIDPGHGGEDGGAVSVLGAKESEINLDIARRLSSLCDLFGVEYKLTRDSEEIDYPAEETTVAARKRWDTRKRLEKISSTPGAVLLSIHQNHYPSAAVRGPQVFYGSAEGSRELAELLQERMTACLYPSNRRLAAPCPEGVYLMKHAPCTAVLCECAFLSNGEEAALLMTKSYREKTALILLSSYLQYSEERHESEERVLLH